jgi:hypothetical protein
LADRKDLSDQELASLRDLALHPGWAVYQRELAALLQRDFSRLGTEDSQRDLRRLQGRVAAFKEVINLPNTFRRPNNVVPRANDVRRPSSIGGSGR